MILLALLVGVKVGKKDRAPGLEEPDDEWVALLTTGISVGRTGVMDERMLVLETTSGDQGSLITAAASAPLCARSRTDGDPSPVLFVGSGGKPIQRIRDHTTREEVFLSTTAPAGATCEMARLGWQSSEAAVFTASYNATLMAAPLAAFLGIPVIFTGGGVDHQVEDTVEQLGCRYGVVIDDAPRPGSLERALGLRTHHLEGGFSADSVGVAEFTLWCYQQGGSPCDYVIVTNPLDISCYGWGDDGKIPIPDLSVLSSILGAQRRGVIVFADGLNQSMLTHDTTDVENVIQMGALASEVNEIAASNRERLLRSCKYLSRYGGEAVYLALVGGPVALPFYYEYFPYDGDDSGGVSFSNTNFVASDYYFANTDDDYEQELAVGRIVGRNLEEASALVARSLCYDEMARYEWNDDGNTVPTMNQWLENSGIYEGTTRVGPLPRCLEHMRRYQIEVMERSGFHTARSWPCQANMFNPETADEVLDVTNYNVYCGHGNHDSWYSNLGAGIIDSDAVSSMNLKPGIAIAMACLTSRIDNTTTTLDESIALSYLHSGYCAYMGASRLAYGLYQFDATGGGRLVTDTGALYLVDCYTIHICQNDPDIGIAFRDAKNDLIAKFDPGSEGEMLEQRIALFEYVLYGDPALNIMVPSFDSM